jgi:hypothetical protein
LSKNYPEEKIEKKLDEVINKALEKSIDKLVDILDKKLNDRENNENIEENGIFYDVYGNNIKLDKTGSFNGLKGFCGDCKITDYNKNRYIIMEIGSTINFGN